MNTLLDELLDDLHPQLSEPLLARLYRGNHLFNLWQTSHAAVLPVVFEAGADTGEGEAGLGLVAQAQRLPLPEHETKILLDIIGNFKAPLQN